MSFRRGISSHPGYFSYNRLHQPHSPCRVEVGLGKGSKDDKWGNINRLNSVCSYAEVNANYNSEFSADLHQTDGELGQVRCFHKHGVIWAFRHQGEEQRQRSLHPLKLSLARCNRCWKYNVIYFILHICLVALPTGISSGSWICCLDPCKLPFPWIY